MVCYMPKMWQLGKYSPPILLTKVAIKRVFENGPVSHLEWRGMEDFV